MALTRMIPVCLSAACSFAITLAAQAPAGQPADQARAKSGARIRADVEFLADDLLEGREAGTRGFDVAARYVATQLALMGVPPGADDGGYFQKVPFRKSSIVSSTVKVGAHRRDARVARGA